jgi:polyphosphate glucokinase
MNDIQKSPGISNPLTLAIDVGGSHLKAGIVDASGSLVSERARVETPKRASPTDVVAALVTLVTPLGHFDRISIGFPGVVRGGRVLTAPNIGTKRWRGFPLAEALESRFHKPARMLNDASVQGLGAITGQGIELVLTLGTGMGFALFENGRLGPHLEMAQHLARKTWTYDEYIGEVAREAIGNRRWNKRVRRAIAAFRTLVGYDMLYLGGGNAKFVIPPLPALVRAISNSAGITGGVRLWDPRLDAIFETQAPAFELAGQRDE